MNNTDLYISSSIIVFFLFWFFIIFRIQRTSPIHDISYFETFTAGMLAAALSLIWPLVIPGILFRWIAIKGWR